MNHHLWPAPFVLASCHAILLKRQCPSVDVRQPNALTLCCVAPVQTTNCNVVLHVKQLLLNHMLVKQSLMDGEPTNQPTDP